MFLIVGSNGNSITGHNNFLGITYGLIAAGFYASLMLLNKFIKNLMGLETTLIQLATASLRLMPYVFLTEGTELLHVTGRSIIFSHIGSGTHRNRIRLILLRKETAKRAEHSGSQLS